MLPTTATRIAICLSAILLSISLLAPVLHAQTLPYDPVGARHMGMGTASVALWNTPEAVYHNPASMVWQTLSVSAGMQPIQWTRHPKAWWVHLHNQASDYGMPIALILQGWDYPTPGGKTGQYMTAALPIAFNFTPSTPGAGTIHFAFERRDDGRWHFNVPFDAGFLARLPSGTTLGITAKGYTFGDDGFESVDPRIEYGAAWGGGPLTISTSFQWRDDMSFDTALDRYRVGGEIGGTGLVHFLGGYIQEDDRWYATGGIALRSDRTARYEFIYSVLYDHTGESFQHFIQYGFKYL